MKLIIFWTARVDKDMTVNMSISVEANNNQSRLKKKKKKRFFISLNIIIIIIIIIVLIIFIIATSDDEELGKGIILSTLIQCIWSLTIE